MNSRPASGRRSSLTVGRSLLFLCLAYVVPFTAIICYLIVVGVGANVRFAAQEKRGNAYLQPLMELLVSVPAHRTAALTRNAADVSRIANESAASWNDLASAQAKLGENLEFTPDGLAKRKRDDIAPDAVAARWTSLRADIARLSPAEIADRHDRIISDLRRMIAHAGDTSNLILDPDLDSYYLMDVTLLALPQTLDRLAQIGEFARGPLTAGTIDDAAAARFAVLGAQLQEADLDRINSSSDTALLEDPNFYGESPTFRARYTPTLGEYKDAAGAVIKSLDALSRREIGAVSADAFAQQITAARKAAAQLSRVGIEELDVLLDRRIASYEHDEFVGLAFTLAAIIATSIVAWWLARRIRRPLASIAEQLQTQANEITAAANELTSTSHSVADGASEQASLVEQTGGTLRDIAARTRASTSAASDATQVTRAANETTARGRAAMERMVTSMREIEAQSTEIRTIVETINGFAFRTNLLALNAAVEAARAGEAGVGFAVVADEVRNLSKRIHEASHDISTRVERSTTSTSQGSKYCAEVAAAFTQIQESVEKVASRVAHIHEANAEHERGMQAAETAVGGIEQVTQANASGAEQTASAAAELAAQSGELRRVLAQLAAFSGNRAADEPLESRTNPPRATRSPISAQHEEEEPVETSV